MWLFAEILTKSAITSKMAMHLYWNVFRFQTLQFLPTFFKVWAEVSLNFYLEISKIYKLYVLQLKWMFYTVSVIVLVSLSTWFPKMPLINWPYLSESWSSVRHLVATSSWSLSHWFEVNSPTREHSINSSGGVSFTRDSREVHTSLSLKVYRIALHFKKKSLPFLYHRLFRINDAMIERVYLVESK